MTMQIIYLNGPYTSVHPNSFFIPIVGFPFLEAKACQRGRRIPFFQLSNNLRQFAANNDSTITAIIANKGLHLLLAFPPETWARLLCCDFCFYNFFKQAGIPALFLYIPVIPLYIPVILAKPNWAADSVSSNGPPVQNQSSSRVTKVKRAIDHPSSKQLLDFFIIDCFFLMFFPRLYLTIRVAENNTNSINTSHAASWTTFSNLICGNLI